MADRTRALLKVLGQGLWQKPDNVVGGFGTTRTSTLWKDVKPERLGTLGLLRELRDTVGMKFVEKQTTVPRGHYAKSGVLGYLAGLGPLAALATPELLDLYRKDAQ